MRNIRTKFLLIGILFFAYLTTFAQQQIQGTLGSINKTSPKFGFNTTAHIPPNFPANGNVGANWTLQRFIDSTVILNPEILRFPGGTNANHWDWQTGWFIPPYGNGTPLMIRTYEFKAGLDNCNAMGLFVLNLETSNVQYEMDGLRHAVSIGINPTLFELGNEHNLDGGSTYPNQLMNGTSYGQLAKPFFDSLKLEFPNSKICVVAGNSQAWGPNPTWNTDVLNQIPTIDALAFHVYINANNSDLIFNVNRALAIPFGNATTPNTLDFIYTVSGFGSLPPDKEVWVTEFNFQEDQMASSYVISQTWTHSLYLQAMMHLFLTKQNITMVINHTLAAGASHYESISKIDNHITANGFSMKLMNDVARYSDTCQIINFSGNPSITYGNATIPKLTGWKFKSDSTENGIICNFSKDTFNISLNNVFSNSINYDQYFADTNFVVVGKESLSRLSGISNDSILIYPFSITNIKSIIPLSNLINPGNISNSLLVYPNPSNSEVTFQFENIEGEKRIEVYSLTGQLIHQSNFSNSVKINLNENGYFFYKIFNDQNTFINQGKLLISK